MTCVLIRKDMDTDSHRGKTTREHREMAIHKPQREASEETTLNPQCYDLGLLASRIVRKDVSVV